MDRAPCCDCAPMEGNMSKSYFVIFALVLQIIWAQKSFACTCAGNSSPCQDYKRQSVFVARIISIDEKTAEIERSGQKERIRTHLSATAAVEEKFSNIEEDEVRLETGGGNGDC